MNRNIETSHSVEFSAKAKKVIQEYQHFDQTLTEVQKADEIVQRYHEMLISIEKQLRPSTILTFGVIYQSLRVKEDWHVDALDDLFTDAVLTVPAVYCGLLKAGREPLTSAEEQRLKSRAEKIVIHHYAQRIHDKRRSNHYAAILRHRYLNECQKYGPSEQELAKQVMRYRDRVDSYLKNS